VPDATIAGAPTPARRATAPVALAPSVDAQPFGTLTPAAPAHRGTGAATRQWGPAAIAFLVIIAAAVALIIYFAAR
jgi:hypothetical protein